MNFRYYSIDKHSIDIICVTETWKTPNIPSDEINIQSYDLLLNAYLFVVEDVSLCTLAFERLKCLTSWNASGYYVTQNYYLDDFHS